MTELRNPVTGEISESQDDYVDDLVEIYYKLKREEHQVREEIRIITDIFEEMADATSDKKLGRISILGSTFSVNVNKKQNVTYPRLRGADHPLKVLMQEFPEIEGMVRTEYKESGTKIQKLLDAYPDLPEDKSELGAIDCTNDRKLQVAVSLSEVREVNPAKSGIEIKELEDE